MTWSNGLRSLLLLLLFVLGSPARADVLVLVHGWSADAETWGLSGVVNVLRAHGWADAGVVHATPAGVQEFPVYTGERVNSIYRAQLPAEAPMGIQAAHLYSQLHFIRQRHPDETLTVAGHSAGGVVARLVTVSPNAPRVDALITIASPNLGTSRAIQGLDLVDSRPFFCPGPGVDILKRAVGGSRYDYLEFSRGALIDLVPGTPGTLIGWLNHQAHPDIAYYSIVHNGPALAGDELVPAFSQDLNQVPPLRGRAHTIFTASAHGLNPNDGLVLAGILNSL